MLLRDGFPAAAGVLLRCVADGGAVCALFRLRCVRPVRADRVLRLLFVVSRMAAAVSRCRGVPGSRRGGAGPGWRGRGQAAGGGFGCAEAVTGSGSMCSRIAAGTACLLLRVLGFLMVNRG